MKLVSGMVLTERFFIPLAAAASMALRAEILAERSDDASPNWEKDRMRALELLP